jgi:hypothetical protein
MHPTAAVLRRFVRGGGGLARKGRGPLHAKFGPRTYYKGNRARSLGRHTRKGGYRIDWANKVPEYIVPGMPPRSSSSSNNLAGQPTMTTPTTPSLAVGAPGWDHGLRPYVSARTPKIVVPPP